MSRTLLGSLIVLIGLLFAFLNKPLAKTTIEIREHIRRPALHLRWARVFIVVEGLVFALVSLLFMLNFLN